MKPLSLDIAYLLTSAKYLAPSSKAAQPRENVNYTTELLHCTIQGEAPDRRYWTEYDHFMVEREARALRRAYVYALIGKAWKRLWQRLRGGRTAASDAPYIGL